MHKFIYIAIAFCFLSANVQAQNKRPVKNEAQLKQELFELNTIEYNHHVKVDLPDDNFLLIDFYRTSYWPEKEALKNIFDIAGSTVSKVKDSFKSTLTSKRLDIHAPVKSQPLSVRIKEHNDGTDLVIINYDQQSPLKLGMDTIRVLKTYNIVQQDEKSKKASILYTFVLKDIEDIASLSNNSDIIKDVAVKLDSVIQSKRDKWKREDTWYHKLTINYTTAAASGNEQLVVTNKGGFLKGLDVAYYLGASVFRNNITPFLEAGGSYKWENSYGNYEYFRLSFAATPLFERVSASQYDFYNLSFINAEFGTLINKSNHSSKWVPLYQTSIGFGYMLSDHPSLKDHKGYKLFWNYSLSSAVRITPEIIMIDRKGQDNLIWPGITVSLKVL